MPNEPTLTVINDSSPPQLQGPIEELAADVAILQAAVAVLEATNDPPTSGIEELAEEIEALDTRLDTAEASITSLNASVTNLNSSVTSIDGTVSSQGTSISSINASVSTLLVDVAALEAAVDALSEGGDLTEITAAIASLTASVATLTADLAALDSSFDTLNSTVTGHTSSISSLSSTVTALSSTVSSLAATVSSLSTTVTNQGTSITSLQSGQTTLTSTVSSLSTTVDGHTTTINNHTSSINALSSSVATLDAALSAVTTRVTATETAIEALNSLVSEMDGATAGWARVTPESLGCHDIDWVSGETTGYDFDNAPILNDWWRSTASRRKILDLGGKTYGIKTSLDSWLTEGRAIDAAGGGLARAESITDGGGFLWTNANSQVGPMFIYRGFGWIFRGVNWRGWYHANYNSLLADTAHYVDRIIEAHGYYPSINGRGVGKAAFDVFHASCFSDCAFDIIQSGGQGEDSNLNEESLGDQYRFGRFFAAHGHTGLRINNLQSVANWIGHYEAGYIVRGIHIKRGGRLKVDMFVQQEDCEDGLFIDGSDTGGGIGEAHGGYEFGSFWIDDTKPTACFAIRTDPTKYNPASIKIFHLNTGSTRKDEAGPIFKLGPYQNLTILSGDGGFARMCEAIPHPTTNSQHYTRWRICNLDFKVGTDLYEGGATPTGLFTLASAGVHHVGLSLCAEFRNVAGSEFNNGEFYDDFAGTVDLG